MEMKKFWKCVHLRILHIKIMEIFMKIWEKSEMKKFFNYFTI